MSGVKLLGNNEILLNEATLVAAVQMLLDASHKDGCAPTVKSVQWDANFRDAGSSAFRVGLSDQTGKAAGAGQ